MIEQQLLSRRQLTNGHLAIDLYDEQRTRPDQRIWRRLEGSKQRSHALEDLRGALSILHVHRLRLHGTHHHAKFPTSGRMGGASKTSTHAAIPGVDGPSH